MPDYGVDFTAEALTDAHQATNWQVQIQLKSEAKGDLVDGGSAISVVFKASALNYLFRGIGLSLIVVYDAGEETLYWEWTANVIAALEAAGRKWLEQETVTVRIPTANKLDDGSADTIRREVLGFHQRIAAAQMATDFVATGVTEAGASATLTALSQDTLATLRANGLLLVSDGHHREVLAAIRQFPESAWENDARILLTVAFAYERGGSPLQALHYANRTPGDSSRSDEELALLEHIRSNSRLSLGQIDLAAHWKAIAELVRKHPNSFVAAQSQLELLTKQVAAAAANNRSTPGLVVDILTQARDSLAKYTEHSAAGDRARWALEVLVAKVEMVAVYKLMACRAYEVGISAVLQMALARGDRRIMADAIDSTAQAAAERLRKVQEEAAAAKATEWTAIAHLTFLEAQFTRLAIAQRIHPPRDEKTAHDTLKATIASAVKLHGQFTDLEMQLMAFRAKRVEGNALVMLGDVDGAAAVKAELITSAQKFGFSEDIAKLMAAPRNAIEEQHAQARHLADASPESFVRMEDEIMQRMGLPEARRPILHQEWLVTQMVARERLNWCRRLEGLQNASYAASPDTHYARPLLWVAHCTLLDHRSSVEDADAAAVVLAFKRAYCDACDRREPFENAM